MTQAPLALPILAGTGLYAAWSDARYRRLYNPLVTLIALGGVGCTIAAAGLAAGGSNLLHAGLALVVGLPLFAWHLFGGGDVKYYAAVASWFPLADGFRLLACVSLAGGVLAAAWLIGQHGEVFPRAGPDSGAAAKVPFGIAIAAGAVLAAWGWPA